MLVKEHGYSVQEPVTLGILHVIKHSIPEAMRVHNYQFGTCLLVLKEANETNIMPLKVPIELVPLEQVVVPYLLLID